MIYRCWNLCWNKFGEKREPGQLALQVYQEQVGGLKGALERKAQTVYNALSWEEQDCARWIFSEFDSAG